MRAIIYILLTIFIITVVRMLAGVILKGVGDAFREQAPRAGSPPPPPPPSAAGGELKRDPVCGTYVPVQTAVRKTIGGRTEYFCSTECRDKS